MVFTLANLQKLFEWERKLGLFLFFGGFSFFILSIRFQKYLLQENLVFLPVLTAIRGTIIGVLFSKIIIEKREKIKKNLLSIFLDNLINQLIKITIISLILIFLAIFFNFSYILIKKILFINFAGYGISLGVLGIISYICDTVKSIKFHSFGNFLMILSDIINFPLFLITPKKEYFFFCFFFIFLFF